MKYKIEDKVKIKTWEEMEKEYGVVDTGSINCMNVFTKSMEKAIEELNCNRILTINYVFKDRYEMKEISWNFSDDMIKYLVKDKIQKNTFKDLLGRDIKIGDNVLHLWTRFDNYGYPQGGKRAISKKLATVIKQTPKGIGIEWRDSRDKKTIKKSTIFNTENRLIVLDGESLKLNYEDIIHDVEKSYEKYKKSMATKNRNLTAENTELKKLIKELIKGSERFELLDLR